MTVPGQDWARQDWARQGWARQDWSVKTGRAELGPSPRGPLRRETMADDGTHLGADRRRPPERSRRGLRALLRGAGRDRSDRREAWPDGCASTALALATERAPGRDPARPEACPAWMASPSWASSRTRNNPARVLRAHQCHPNPRRLSLAVRSGAAGMLYKDVDPDPRWCGRSARSTTATCCFRPSRRRAPWSDRRAAGDPNSRRWPGRAPMSSRERRGTCRTHQGGRFNREIAREP